MTWAINLIVALKFESRMRTSQYWPVHIRTYVLQRQREVQRTGNICRRCPMNNNFRCSAQVMIDKHIFG